ncbi:1598_t:CDS:2, partial [Acaulospora colombiana]
PRKWNYPLPLSQYFDEVSFVVGKVGEADDLDVTTKTIPKAANRMHSPAERKRTIIDRNTTDYEQCTCESKQPLANVIYYMTGMAVKTKNQKREAWTTWIDPKFPYIILRRYLKRSSIGRHHYRANTQGNIRDWFPTLRSKNTARPEGRWKCRRECARSSPQSTWPAQILGIMLESEATKAL